MRFELQPLYLCLPIETKSFEGRIEWNVGALRPSTEEAPNGRRPWRVTSPYLDWGAVGRRLVATHGVSPSRRHG